MELSQPKKLPNKIGAVFSEIEAIFIRNRRDIFAKGLQKYNGNPADWAKNQYSLLGEYRAANMKTLTAFKKPISESISYSITQSYIGGVKAVDNRLGEMKGHVLGLAFATVMTSALTQIGRAQQIALAASEQQYFEIISKAASSYGGGDFNAHIDRASIDALNRGLVGAVRTNNAKFNIVTLTEAIERNEAHTAILTGSGARAEEHGIFTVLISAHARSCPLCFPWQNQVLINDVYANGQPDGKHVLMSEAVDAGLFHYNCMHNYSPFVEGVDKPIYGKDIQPERKNDANYEAQQQQRRNEEMIRQWKRREEGSLTDHGRHNAAMRVEYWQARQRQFISDVNARDGQELFRQYNREQLGGHTEPQRIIP